MTYRVEILPRAKSDVGQVFGWIAERSADGADRWLKAFESAVEKLVAHPTSYGRAPEDELTDYDLRQFLFKTRRGRIYRGVYVVVDEEIKVLRVRGPGQSLLEPDELE